MLWWPFCSAEQNHFSNFDRGSSKEHFCEIILKSTHWPWRRGHLKGFSIFSSDGHFVQQSGTILAILVEGHPRTICVKLFLKSAHWPREKMLFKVFFPIFYSDSHFVQPCRDIFSNFGIGSSKEHLYEIIWKSAYQAWWRCRFMGFSIFSSGGHYVKQSRTILAIL